MIKNESQQCPVFFQREFHLIAMCCLLFFSCSGCHPENKTPAGESETDTQLAPVAMLHPPISHAENPALNQMLNYYDRRFNTQKKMVQFTFNNPGYHSRIPTGVKVHRTRESLAYALGLLQRAKQGDRERAFRILDTVIDLQDQKPGSETEGVWPWLLEEPIEKMSAPDFNWADFCGALLAHVLVMHREHLPEELTLKMKKSLQRATNAIRKRDIQPGYTNIAILGGGVCAVAGEILHDATLSKYGKKRLQKVVSHVQHHSGFTEYNSPPYAKVVIAECERFLELSSDDQTRSSLEFLRRTAWKVIAESFHPGTNQWAGPHSRTSRDRLRKSTTQFLSDRVGKKIKTHWTMNSEQPRGYAVVSPRSCPEEHLHLFNQPKEKPYQLQRTFIRGQTEETSVTGTTWFTPAACLGSANYSIFWTQRKPIIGYWKSPQETAVVFRVRFLHEGKDFASMAVHTAQKDEKILASFHSVSDKGDWHTSLDRPANQVFRATDFRVRFELQGNGVSIKKMDDQKFALIAGDHQIIVHTLPGKFAGHEVRWRTGEYRRRVHLDGVCYLGEAKDFSFASKLPIQLAAGIELISINKKPLKSSPQFHGTKRSHVVWTTPKAPSLRVSLTK